MKPSRQKRNGASLPVTPKQLSCRQSTIYFLLIRPLTLSIQFPYKLSSVDLKAIFRKHGVFWSSDDKTWMMNMKDNNDYKQCYYEVRQYFKEHMPDAKIAGIPDFVLTMEKEFEDKLQVRTGCTARLISYNKLQTEIDISSMPFFNRLYDFQKKSLEFGVKHHGRLLLADEMGVGKTVQSLAIACIYRHEWPLLIITPSTLRLNWKQQILNWMNGLVFESDIQVYAKGGTTLRQNTKICIISYDLAWKCTQVLQKFNVVITDQAHYLKNSTAKRTEVLVPFLSNRKRIILLTGTPAFAKPRQFYNLLSIVRPDVFYKFQPFGYRYCDPQTNPWSRAMEFNGCMNSKELFYIVKDKIMIRRLKSQVLTQLPDKQRQKIIVEADKNQCKEIKQLINITSSNKSLDKFVGEMLNTAFNDGAKDDRNRQAVMEAYRLSGKAKIDGVKDYIAQLLQNQVKILIFAHHQFMLDSIEEEIKSKQIKYIRIDGSVSNQARHQRVNQFQNDQKILAAILSITAAGVGLTLTEASTVVFAQLHWTPAMMIQAEDRAHRIGQKCSVNCHYLIGQNTLDSILYGYLEKKVADVSSFVDGKEVKMEIEKLQKGKKGKVSKKTPPLVEQKQSLLFKFDSVEPLLRKNHRGQTQQSDISSQISSCETMSFASSHRKKLIQIQEQPENLIQSRIKDQQQQIQETMLLHRNSSDLAQFILNNSQLLHEFSQKKEQPQE